MRKLKAVFPKHKIDALLVTRDVNIRYLTGFPAGESWLLVGQRRSYYLTDSRYIQEAKEGLKGASVVLTRRSIAETFFETVRKAGIKNIGFDTRYMTLSQYRDLKRRCPREVRLVKADQLVEDQRMIKDKGEIKKIGKALSIHKLAYAFLKKNIKPNIKENELSIRLERFVQSKGAGLSFPSIIASGPNSCYPHAKVTQRRFRRNEGVLIDMGVDVEGYKSDLTRMFFLGKIPALIRPVFEAVREAQMLAIAGIKAGVKASDIDLLARNSLKKRKLDKYFGHALGHGVGLEVHESPRLAHNDATILKEGMVLTVEPAVYIPGKFGVRLEDMVLVGKNDCEILSDDIH